MILPENDGTATNMQHTKSDSVNYFEKAVFLLLNVKALTVKDKKFKFISGCAYFRDDAEEKARSLGNAYITNNSGSDNRAGRGTGNSILQ